MEFNKNLAKKVGVLVTIILLITVTANSVINNFQPPIADAGSDICVDVYDTISFDASGSTPSESIINYTWYFHDLSDGIAYGKNVDYSFTIEGIYHVSLIVTKSNGLTDLDTVKVEIKNEIPRVSLPANIVIEEGTPLTLTPTVVDDDESFEYEWDMGDGTIKQTSSVSHGYDYAGEYKVRLKVYDDQGAFGYDEMLVTSYNTPPKIVEVITPSVLNEDQNGFFSVVVNDSANDQATMEYLWYFGDGIMDFENNLTHAYTKNDTFKGYVVARDDSGLTDSASFTVKVKNVNPNANINDITISEGENYIFSDPATDTPSDIPLLDYDWSFGDEGWQASYSQHDDHEEDITVTVTDDDGAVAQDSAHVSVLNVAPSLSVTDVYIKANLGLRIAGTPENSINFTLYENDKNVWEGNLERTTGPPNTTSLENFVFHLDKKYTLVVSYNHERGVGSNPVWLYMEFENEAKRMFHHVFNTVHEDSWLWNLELNKYFFKNVWCDDCSIKICDSEKEWNSEYENEKYNCYLYRNPFVHVSYQIFDQGKDDLNLEFNYTYVNCSSGGCCYGVHPSHHGLCDDVWCECEKDEEYYLEYRNYSASGYPNRVWDELIYYPYSYNQSLSFTVEDDDSGYHMLSIDILDGYLNNTAPSLRAGSDITTYENSELLFNAEISDRDAIEVTWDMGDGNVLYGETVSHEYDIAGDYLVICSVDDGDMVTKDGFVVHVNNIVPTAIVPAVSGYEGKETEFSSTVHDSEYDLGILRYSWEFGNYSVPSKTAKYIYEKGGNYSVELIVQDDNGLFCRATGEVVIEGKEPTIVDSVFEVPVNRTAIVSIDFADSMLDMFTSNVTWNLSGDIRYGPVTAYRFDMPGEYSVNVSVTDNDNNTVYSEYIITVTNIAPEISVPNYYYYYGPEDSISIESITYDTSHDISSLVVAWNEPDVVIGDIYDVELEHTGVTNISVRVTDRYSATDESYVIIIVRLDNDGDGLLNEIELQYGSDVNLADTDGDYIIDSEEVVEGTDFYITDINDIDSDGDYLFDGYSFVSTQKPDNDMLCEVIEDNNELYYIYYGELSFGCDPTNPDTDGDGLPDGLEVYGWMTYIRKESEVNNFRVRSNPLSIHSDADGLTDYDEYMNGTNPSNNDTDGDTLWDGYNLTSQRGELSLGLIPYDYDTDHDNVADNVELDNSYLIRVNGVDKLSSTSPWLSDTDGDGLDDYEERNRGVDRFWTNGTNQDTDGDGLSDSSELYTKKYSYGERKHVNGDNATASMNVELDSNYPKEVKVIYGVRKVSGAISLKVKVGTSTVKDVSITDAYVYDTVDLWQIYGAGSYTVTIKLIGYPNGEAYLEDFQVLLVERTDPCNRHSDNDGINDYEEVNMGEDGWITNPLEEDTDGDGWSDNYEINTKGTSPINADTDNDGVNDPYDIDPLHNLLLIIKVYAMQKQVLVNEVLFANLTVDSPDIQPSTFYTEHIEGEIINQGETDWLNYHQYYVDVPDFKSSVPSHTLTCKFKGYAGVTGGDAPFISKTEQWTLEEIYNNNEWHLITNTFTSGSGHKITYGVEAVTIQQENTIAVYNETLDYYSDGQVRYPSDNKYYVLYLDSTDSSGVVSSGLNVILVPAGIFIESELKKRIDEGDMSMFYGGSNLNFSFYTEGDSSSSIVGILSGEGFSASQILNILDLIIVNNTGSMQANYSRIGNVYLANLPNDVVMTVPFKEFTNSKTGAAPSNWFEDLANWLVNTAVSIAETIWNGLVAIANFIYDLGTALIKLGYGILVGIFTGDWSVAAAAIEEVVEIIENAINALVEAMVSVMASIFNAVINPIISMLNVAVLAIGSAMMAVAEDSELLSNVYSWMMLSLVIAIGAAFVVLTTVLGYLIMSMPLIGLVITAILSAVLFAIIATTILNSPYYATGQNMDTSQEGIGDYIEDKTDSAIALTFLSFIGFLGPIFSAIILEPGDNALLLSFGLYFLAIFSGMAFYIMTPDPVSGTAMVFFLALTCAAIGASIYGALMGIIKSLTTGNWGKVAAIGLLYLVIFASLGMSIKADLGYIEEAFT